jgi:hypothetical protein
MVILFYLCSKVPTCSFNFNRLLPTYAVFRDGPAVFKPSSRRFFLQCFNFSKVFIDGWHAYLCV